MMFLFYAVHFREVYYAIKQYADSSVLLSATVVCASLSISEKMYCPILSGRDGEEDGGHATCGHYDETGSVVFSF